MHHHTPAKNLLSFHLLSIFFHLFFFFPSHTLTPPFPSFTLFSQTSLSLLLFSIYLLHKMVSSLQFFPHNSPYPTPQLLFCSECRRSDPGLDSEAGSYRITSLNYIFLVAIYTGLYPLGDFWWHQVILKSWFNLGSYGPRKEPTNRYVLLRICLCCLGTYSPFISHLISVCSLSCGSGFHFLDILYHAYTIIGILRIISKTAIALLQSSPFQIPSGIWHFCGLPNGGT